MKTVERNAALNLRRQGYSIKTIANRLNVAKSSVSIWVKDVELTSLQIENLNGNMHAINVIEKRRATRLRNEQLKRDTAIAAARSTIDRIDLTTLKLLGVMLYWAEGGKTQNTVRFSNSDPNMIKIMMAFFIKVCKVPETKFRGYIHIHPHLDYKLAEQYWSDLSGIPLNQFFATYRKMPKSSQQKRDKLPHGTFDIYVLDTKLFYQITGWAQGIFSSY